MTVAPGSPVPELIVLTIVRLGLPGVSGVESLAELSLGSMSGAELVIVTVFVVEFTPEGRGLTTVTAKILLLEAPATRAPWTSVQVEPALPLGEQLQPGLLAAALKVVWAGTVSARVVAGALPGPAFL